jgi:hypothetical protein
MIPLPSLKLIGYCALGMLAAGLMLALTLERRHSRHLQASVTQLTALRAQDAANFKAAAVQAQAQNHAKVVQVEAKATEISEKVTHDYQANLAALRAAGRVRAASQANSSRADGGRASPVCPPASGIASQAVPSDQPDLAYTSEVELQLNALIDWTKRQAAVDPNAP